MCLERRAFSLCMLSRDESETHFVYHTPTRPFKNSVACQNCALLKIASTSTCLHHRNYLILHADILIQQLAKQ
jgi:hypothetical protein